MKHPDREFLWAVVSVFVLACVAVWGFVLWKVMR